MSVQAVACAVATEDEVVVLYEVGFDGIGESREYGGERRKG